MTEQTECPNCGKKSIVQSKEGLYRCLNCDFKRDFSQPPKRKSDNSFFWASLIGAIFALLLLQMRKTPLNPPNFEYQSYPTSRSVQLNEFLSG